MSHRLLCQAITDVTGQPSGTTFFFVCHPEDGTYRLKKLATEQYSEIYRRSEDLKMKPLLSKTI